MTRALDPILEAIREARSAAPQDTRLATVTDVTIITGVAVRFDGEVNPSARRYRATVTVEIGDRVLMLRVGSTWVVTGVLSDGVPAATSAILTPAESIPSYAGVIYRTINWSLNHTHPDYTWHANGTGTVRVNRPGLYRLEFTATWQNQTAAGGRSAHIMRNGVILSSTHTHPVDTRDYWSNPVVWVEVYLAANDYVEWRVHQTSGTTVVLAAGSRCSVRRLRG